MKKIKITLIALLVLSVGFFALHCQHDDSETIPVTGPDPIVRGNLTMSCTNCNTSQPAGSVGIWWHDKSHSNVEWETRYKSGGSLLTGRFDQFFINSLTFDEATPSNIQFDAYVWLNSVNTSEPGRDDGCLLTTFGTANVIPDNNATSNKATLISKQGTGRYSTTDEGFLVDADFTFKGVTKTVTVKMFLAPRYVIDGAVDGAGLQSEFDINRDDFIPGDPNVGDIIRIRINNTMRIRK